MVNPKCIEVFLSLVEHKSISAVAKSTYLSQPTVSEYLNQLETLVGTTLVLRGKGQRQITLTPAGEAFLPLARKWMDYQLELEHQILQFRQTQPHSALRLAASSGAHQLVVSDIIYKLLARCPDVKVQLCNTERREMLSAIEDHSFDIAFVFGNIPESDLVEVVPLFEEDQYVLCPGATPLPNRTLTPEDLDPQYEISYTGYLKSERFQAWHRSCFSTQPASAETQRIVVSSLASVHHYLTDPKAWAVIPASIAMTNISQKAEQLTFRRLEPAPPCRTCSVLIAKAYGRNKLVQDFLQCCTAFTEERSYLHKL